MPYYRTWEFNDFPTPSGPKRIRVNAGRLGYGYGDSYPMEMCRLDRSMHVVVSLGASKKSRSNEKGLMVADAKDIVLEDFFAYTGKVSGSAVSETLGGTPAVGIPNSLLQRIFGGIAVTFSGDASAPTSAITLRRVDTGLVAIKKGDVLRIGGQQYTVLLDGEVTDASGRVIFITPALITTVTSGTLAFIRPLSYEVFFSSLGDDGTLKEPYFSGDVDPDNVTALDSIFLNPHTSVEQKRRTVKITVDAAATRFSSLTVRDLLHDANHGLLTHPPTADASTGNMVYGKFYAGHINGSDQYPTAGPNGESFFGRSYTEYAVARYDPTGVAPNAFPQGLHGILISTIFDRLAKVAGLSGLKGGTFTSAFDFWVSEWQQVAVQTLIASATNIAGVATITTTTPHGLVTGDSVVIQYSGQGYDHRWFVTVLSSTVFTLIGWQNDWSITVHTGTVYPKDYRLQYKLDPTSLCVIFQYLFGINPIDGTESRTWPITWPQDKSLADCLTLLANQFGATARTEIDSSGNVWLAVEARRDDAQTWVNESGTLTLESGTLPKNLTLATSSLEARQISKAAVKIKNTADSGAYYSPIEASGETIDIEIPFRAHRLAIRDAGLIINTKWNANAQWQAFKIERPGVSPPISDDNGWVGASLLYFYGYIQYPADYETQWAKTAKSFYCVNYIVIKGTPKDENANYFNSVIAPAKFFEQEFIHDGVVIRRSYGGAADDKGFLQTLRPGLAASWMEDEDVRLFRMDEVTQDEVDNRLEVTWVSGPSVDDGMVLPPVVTAGEDSGSTGGSSGSSQSTGTSTQTTVAQLDLYSPVRRTVLFYDQGMNIRKSLVMDVFSYVDTVTGKITPEYGWCPSAGDASGMVMKVYFQKVQHKWGTGTVETGDVAISGVSTTGVPDYFATFKVMAAAGEGKTNSFRILYSGFWSRRLGNWDIQKLLEHTAFNRRIIAHGRFQVFRSDGSVGAQWVNLGLAGTYRCDWLDLSDPYAPMSDKEITTYDGGVSAPPWNAFTNYVAKNRVAVGGIIYSCISPNTNQSPPNATYWEITFLPFTEDTSYNNPVPPTFNTAYARPIITPVLTVNGSLRITLDFGTRLRVMSCTHDVCWGDSGQKFAVDFRRERSKCQLNNGVANQHCVDLEISLLDFSWAQAGAPFLWQVLHRDDPADPALPPNLCALLYDVIVTLEPIGEDVS